MQSVYVCIGNGLHADGEPSNISRQIVMEALETFDKMTDDPDLKCRRFIFSGGYKNADGITEATAMFNFALRTRPDLASHFSLERESYRTHNNAVCVLDLVKKLFDQRNVLVHIFDHPSHIGRTKLAFEKANRLYHGERYTFIIWGAKEVYDSEIPGKPYWISRREFAKREKWTMTLYRTLLFRPWDRIGFWILRTVWPSNKQ